MNPFQRYRAAPITPITFSGAPYHNWSCRFQLTSRRLPNRPRTSGSKVLRCSRLKSGFQVPHGRGRLGRRPPQAAGAGNLNVNRRRFQLRSPTMAFSVCIRPGVYLLGGWYEGAPVPTL